MLVDEGPGPPQPRPPGALGWAAVQEVVSARGLVPGAGPACPPTLLLSPTLPSEGPWDTATVLAPGKTSLPATK